MVIILYSETTAQNISSNLGKSEYSYFFVLKSYLPALQELGELVYVADPATEVDPLYHAALARNESAVFISFSPPHRTELELKCPTICVLAWEFSSVPNEDWGRDPRDNWVESIKKIGNIVTISQYSTDVIRQQLGEAVNIATIPGPVTARSRPANDIFRARLNNYHEPRTAKSLTLNAEVIDTQVLDISEDIVCFRDSLSPEVQRNTLKSWDRQAFELQFSATSRLNSGVRYLVGFYDSEAWGAWSRSSRPWISLPMMVAGEFELDLELIAYKENDGREIGVTIGNQTRTLVVSSTLSSYSLTFTDVSPAASIQFSNLVVGYTIGADLLRALSIGIGRLSIRAVRECDSSDQQQVIAPAVSAVSEHHEEIVTLDFSGVVYTSVFNPEDGRKNWEDIITAFCWAFRDDASKTLLLKFTCPTMSSVWSRLFMLFSQLSPFQCRIVVIHGYLSDFEMKALAAVTDYVVNASHAEGQCLPLLEFMVDGVPAISPDHTAMASYINRRNAFVVDTSLVNTCWPHDPREYDRTLFYRIDWASLRDCYIESARVRECEPGRYRKMAYNAAATVCTGFSQRLIFNKLREYIHGFDS